MSRSYKHTPRHGQSKFKAAKRIANRIVRRHASEEDYPQHGGYRKRTESWAICDGEVVGWSFEEFYRNEVRKWHMRRELCPDAPYPSRAAAKKEYRRRYLRK